MGLVTKIFGSKNDRELRRLWPRVEQINALEKQFKALDDGALRAKTAEFKERIDRGETLDELLPEAFAVTREGAVRALGMRHFDVQLLGGIVLHDGKIAEMKTGEGKTLTGTLPVYLNALSGKGVHVVTVNDYLARRDAEWMGQVYGFLGLTTGVVVVGDDHLSRQDSYAADITYGQNNEFGFDYLRDNMKLELSEKVQRVHNFAIVDEVDSILIDESRTPLIISGPSHKPTELYQTADEICRKLKADDHYSIELKSKQTLLTDEGVEYIEKLLNIDNLYDPQNIEMVHHVTQALKAHATMKRDVDYVVRDNQVIIVDEFTGRLMAGRRWSDGLHQAVEAKEHVRIQQENQTLATITFQNYFRMYKKLAGMTGTADTEAVEFKKIYNLDVIVMPTNAPMIRKDHADVVYPNERGKYRAVCREIKELHETGQPILVGTASIAHSEKLSELLIDMEIPHTVLNAKQHEREAEIVAQAGRFSAVTIATNMAGRGTDIVLGGNPDSLAASEAGTRDPNEPAFQEALEKYKTVCAEERQKVLAAGGLHILGTERHESRRIDNQLRGRSGRQGDPGSSRFYVSLDDDLMKRFGGEKMQMIMQRFNLGDDDAIEGGLVGRAIEKSQKRVEGYHFDVRKHLLEFDDVMNKQREVIYGLREQVMHELNIWEQVEEMIGDVVEAIVLANAREKEPVSDWNITAMFQEVARVFGLRLDPAPFQSAIEGSNKTLAQDLFELFKEEATKKFEERKAHVGVENMQKLVSIMYLQAIDSYWKEHLTNMDALKEGINLRGYAQKNPLHEYQRESFELFTSMMMVVKTQVLQSVFLVQLLSQEELEELERRERERVREQEAAAQTIHQDVQDPADAEPAEAELVDDAKGNRAQRRMQQTRAPKEDYAPTAVGASKNERDRKDAARRKAKDARKARKKAR